MSHELPSVSPNAKIQFPHLLSHTTSIGRNSSIYGLVSTEKGVTVGKSTKINGPSYIGRWVEIGPNVRIAEGALILERAKICPNGVTTWSSDARSLQPNVSIGPDVLLHNEVELGPRAIIPTQRTIACIGNFGTKNRVVTIYGDFKGPKFSIGCQIGVSFGEIEQNVHDSLNTSPESAATYMPYLPVFQSIGSNVQGAFDSEMPLVAEMLERRVELGLG